jgi:hypothetical protein
MVQTRTSVFPPSLLCGDHSIALSGLILADLGQLDLIKKVSGSQRETIVREAWARKLGNRCAIDWVLDQHKEKKPKEPIIRDKFDNYELNDLAPGIRIP